MKQLKNILEMDEKTFDKKIIDWAGEFGFRIDGDYININQKTVDDFINLLDNQFELWEKYETTGIAKMEKHFANKVNRTNQQQLDAIEPFSLKKESSASRKKYEYFVNLGKNYVKSKQYKEALNNYQQAHKVSEDLYNANLTIEIDELIKQTKSLIDKEQKTKEKQRREARLRKIISFRGTQIPQFEADILQKLEKQLNNQFMFIKNKNYFGSNNEMAFTAENQRVTGIQLFDCGITTLPEFITKLESLQELYLTFTQLSTLPESISNISSLETLVLDNNNLTTLPESIGALKSLEMLILEINKITALPESIGNLKSLKELYLGENQLSTLPESIGDLKSLQLLYLYDNKLTTLPESITNLKSLQYLDLKHNKLSTLPESITNMTSLINLYIEDNPLDSRAKSVLKQLKKKGVNVST